MSARISFIWNLLLLVCTVRAWSSTNSYAPAKVNSCPSTLVRSADGLNSKELTWLSKRKSVVTQNFKDFLRSRTTFSESEIENMPYIPFSLSFSGGGYRAMLCGAGQISALDNRTVGAEHGLGGLLQSSTYLAGLSGGNWLVGTLSINNFTSVQKILDEGKIWDLEHSIFLPEGVSLSSYKVLHQILKEAETKAKAGFNITITDIWARALSRNFFNDNFDYYAPQTWSDIRNFDVFKNGEMPMPISLSDGRYPGTTIVNLNSTNFEATPFEFGSWDPSLAGFADIKYLGSKIDNGTLKGNVKCIEGYDSASFIMGTSSSLFNSFLAAINTQKYAKIPNIIKDFAKKFLSSLSERYIDTSLIKPNPFYNFVHKQDNITSSIMKSETLYLVDGGEDGQNVPLSPVIQPLRQQDAVIAFDNSNDINSFPSGKSLVRTYERQFGPMGVRGSFPYVPSIDTFVMHNLTERPVFFGCDAKNLTSLSGVAANGSYVPPLVVYIANRKISYASNTSTFKMEYDTEEKYSMIKNGFEVASMANLTEDKSWATCLSCALVRRHQERSSQAQSETCKKCFQEYCWNGKIYAGDSSKVSHSGSTFNGTLEVGNSSSTVQQTDYNAAESDGASKGTVSSLVSKIKSKLAGW